ncbi:hypothetical protein, partial [Oenococcus oeni]
MAKHAKVSQVTLYKYFP